MVNDGQWSRRWLLGLFVVFRFCCISAHANTDTYPSAPSSIRNNDDGCVLATGLEENHKVIQAMQYDSSNNDGGIVEPLLNFFVWGHHVQETPILLRNYQWTMVGMWGVAAAHHSQALDFFGRVPAHRRCQSPSSSSMLLPIHNAVALGYSILFAAREWFSTEASIAIADRMKTHFGLDPTICDNNDNDDGGACGADPSTPWGLAYQIVQETRKLALEDGWNADGSYNRDYYRIPFQDWRPQGHYYVPDYTQENSWKPLLEHDGLGYLTRQEHVTPHIGQTAKSFFLSDPDICRMEAPNPKYDYKLESYQTLERTLELVTDPIKAAQVELFDNKVLLFTPLITQYYKQKSRNNQQQRPVVNTTQNNTTESSLLFLLESFEFIQAFAIMVTTLYEATIVVWKEKVRHDLIRPTTKIHQLLQNQTVRSFVKKTGDDDQGQIQLEDVLLKANEWEPIIRTMPHAEYPSASACVCTAAAEALRALFGTDHVQEAMGGPLEVLLPLDGSKLKVFVGDNIRLEYDSWTAVAQACGQSRLWGGMHFTAAVPQGETLCAPIGPNIVQAVMELSRGMVPPVVYNHSNNGRPNPVRCPKNGNDNDTTENGNEEMTSGCDSIRLFRSVLLEVSSLLLLVI